MAKTQTVPAASITLHVRGMTCAACVGHVTEAILAVPGVSNAQVSLATNSALVEYAPETLDLSEVGASVREAGYRIDEEAITADASTTDSLKASESRHAADQRDLDGTRNRATYAIAVAVLIMVVLALRSSSLLDFATDSALNVVFLVLVTPIQMWSGAPFYASAWAAAKRRTSNMNTLVVVGTSVAFAYSVVVTVAQLLPGDASLWAAGSDFVTAGHGTGTYFEISAAIIGLVSLGRWLEGRTRLRSAEAVRMLIQLQPTSALVETDEGPAETPIDQIRVGDQVILRPGERIPVDGQVNEGTAEIDESMLTGESTTATKSNDDYVFAGTQNLTGSLRVRTIRVVGETLLAQIIRQVEQAQASRAPIERLVDRVTGKFVPIVLIISIATFVMWMMLAPEPRLQNALLIAVTVTVIACPCALGLATPTAIVAGIGRAAGMGVLIKNAATLEQIAKVDTIAFDKTGTLTEGAPRVVEVATFPNSPVDEEKMIALAAAAEVPSEHPIGNAIVDEAKLRNVEVPTARGFRSIPGEGVFAEVNGLTVSVTNSTQTESISEIVGTLGAEGNTVVIVSIEGTPAAAISLSDAIRPDAMSAVRTLHDLDIETHLLTGDKRPAAQAVARSVGVSHVTSELLPTDKAAHIEGMNSSGRITAMIGDGINDGPALATAHIGVAMASGTDIAIETADVTLTRNQPSAVALMVSLSRKTSQIIRQNLFWAFVYNLLLIPIAAGALHPIFASGEAPAALQFVIGNNGFLNPVAAAAAMAISSLSVSLNSLRLRRFR